MHENDLKMMPPINCLGSSLIIGKSIAEKSLFLAIVTNHRHVQHLKLDYMTWSGDILENGGVSSLENIITLAILM